MTLGSTLAQVAHAASESIECRLPPQTHVVILEAKNEDHLRKIEQQLIRHKIIHKAIREPDMNNSLTAIGIAPIYDRNSIKFITKKLRLFKKIKGGEK